jgi:hypothetical protein
MNEDDSEETVPTKYVVESSLGEYWQKAGVNKEKWRLAADYLLRSNAVFNKLVLTALKFTPVVLAKHMPYKVTSHGRL